MSTRKHISQMSKEEEYFLWKKLFGVNVEQWNITGHLLKRLDERGGNFEDILSVIFNGTIIEYHSINNNNRILVRGKRSFNGSVICAVFEPETRNVITLYWNRFNDNHKTIDMQLYIADLDIVNSWKSTA